jgi:hypothetical protein
MQPGGRKTASRFLEYAAALVLVAGLCSCQPDHRPPLVVVRGQVFLGGKPAYKAVVWLHPTEPGVAGVPRPHAAVAEDGSFAIGTYKLKDGAPAGTYRVTVCWRQPARAGDEDGASFIPLRYMDPLQAGFPVVDVEEDPVEIPALHLSRE